MSTESLDARPRALTRRGVLRAAAVVAATAAAVVLIDRFWLPEVLQDETGAALVRCRVVPGPPGQPPEPGTVWVRPTAGPREGERVRASYGALAGGAEDSLVGSGVFVEFGPGRAEVKSIARDRLLLVLAGVLVGLVAAIAGAAVTRLLPALLAGVGVLLGILAPSLAAGVSPVAAGLATAAVFLLAGALLIGRASRRSLGILAGAAGGLAVAAAVGVAAIRAGRLTGVYSALTSDLYRTAAVELDFRQMLLGGMIVGACAIILDLAAAVTTAVFEVAAAGPHLPRRRLAAAGLDVGRDVMGTELNTLIFAYAGAHFGIVLMPLLGSAVKGFEKPALLLASDQQVAVELYAMLAGTIALVLTIPMTAAAAAALARRGGLPPADGDAPPPAGRRGRRIGLWAGGPAVFAAAWVGSVAAYRSAAHRYDARPTDPPGFSRWLVQARVTAAEPSPDALLGQLDAWRRAGEGLREQVQRLTCTVTSGGPRGATVAGVPNAVSARPLGDRLIAAGDEVLLLAYVRDGRVVSATVRDFSRGPALIHFGFVLVSAVLLVGRVRGLRALAALAVCGSILYAAILVVAALGRGEGAGGPPRVALPVFLAAAAPMCVLVFLILAGASRKTLAGAGGAFGGLLVGGAVAVAAAGAMHLSGRESDSMAAIRFFAGAGRLDYRGLLQAGMVLGVVGAGMDVAIAIASAVHQVRLVKPAASAAELLAAGLAVGRGIMVPMVLVLTFAYVGLSLPLLILPGVSGQPLPVLLSNERISVEALRILVGGIGVACTVPVTAVLAAAVSARRKSPFEREIN